jgi:antitoxin component YwqK of YwqJK toxin-antitoxin module
MGMELRSLIWKLLREQVDQNTINLKNKYVGEGKPISEEDFNKLVEVTGDKFYLLSWLTKKVGTGIIKAEDIYKYKEYFDLYEKNKKKFEHKDIHLYKTAEDVKKFLQEIVKLREGNIVFDEIQGKDNFVSQNDIEKLQSSGGIKYLGIYDNGDYKYQVFEVFGVNKDVWKLYRDILGRCKGRDKGAKIDICTIGQYSYFKSYLNDPKGSSYFLLFNLDDRRSPYQLHHESGQFMDKNDYESHKIKQIDFFKFVGDRVPKYSIDAENFPSQFEIPVKDNGFEDKKGRKQGLWKYFYGGGQLAGIHTYKNGEEDGPFVKYYSDGGIEMKGTRSRDVGLVGEYEENFKNGRTYRKGTYNSNGKFEGLWTMGDYDGVYKNMNFSDMTQTGYTSTGRIRYVSQIKNQSDSYPFGKTIFYGRTGKVEAIGKIGASRNYLGKWTYYFPNGDIRSEGSFLKGYRNGPWTDVVKSKDGNRYIFEADFIVGMPSDKVNVYDKNGEFLKKVSPKKIEPPYWENNYFNIDKFTIE